jgi:hypothetical protein
LAAAARLTHGVLLTATGTSDQLTAAGDAIARRLLGEYAVTVTTHSPAPVMLSLTSPAGTASVILTPPGSAAGSPRPTTGAGTPSPATPRPAHHDDDGLPWQIVAGALAALLLAGHVLAARQARRAQRTG